MQDPAPPETLPRGTEQCRTFREYRNLVLMRSQCAAADLVGLKQARISAVESGRVIPRRKTWARLMAAYAPAVGPVMSEAEFYRFLQAARLERSQLLALRKPIAETEPLMAAARVTVLRPYLISENLGAPAGVPVRAQG